MPAVEREPLDRETLLGALRACDWMIATAARRLEMSRQAVYDALKRHGIQRRLPPKRALIEAKREGGKIAGNGRPRRQVA